MRLFNEIAKRAVAALLLAATAFASITYSLGYYEISFIDRGGDEYDDTTIQNILGTLEPGTNISEFTGDIGDITTSPDSAQTTVGSSGTTAPEITTGQLSTGTVAPDTTVLPDTPVIPGGLTSLADYLAAGYKITWADYDPSMKFAELTLGVDGLDQYTLGNTKKVRVQLERNYGEGHREIGYYAIKTETRPTLELYMGYIIVDSGVGNVLSGISDRLYTDENRVSIYSSNGKFIGIYPGSEVIPAYTRDKKDRAVFYYNGVYYYLDESTGRFAVSDYNPDTDSRGLFFDYNPDFGKSDCKYQIFSTEQTITETFTLDTTSYFTRYGVDSRLAEQLYLYYPKFANQIALTFDNGRYYNRLFAEKLKDVIKGVQSGAITLPPETTQAPETTSTPETTEVPDMTEPSETTVLPETIETPETTVIPETTSEPETSATEGSEETDEAAEPLETETAPDTSEATEVSETADEPETVSEPDITTSPETTASPETETIPEESEEATHVITEDTTAAPPQARSIISTTDDKDENGIPDTITLDISYKAYRFTYRASQPKVDLSKVTTNKYTYNRYITQTVSWNTDFKYARAYNFSENRAYTVDSNGIVKIINTNGNAAVYLYNTFLADSSAGSFYHFEYYTEPFERDEYMLGHFYYSDGLIRMRVVERLPYKLNIYEDDYEVLLDINGNKVSIVPEGYTLVSYSNSVFLLERNGRYGYYHRDGYWVAQPIYTYAAPFIEGLAVVGYEDGAKGVIDTSGNIVIPFIYTSISNSSSGLFACFSETEGWKVYAKVSK